MKRETQDRAILDKFALDFVRVIEAYTEYIIVSGFVVISSGRVRGTEDIDLIIKPISEKKFKDLNLALAKAGFKCIQSEDAKEIYSYLKDKLSVRYVYKDVPLPEMEVKFAIDELDEYQFKTKKKLPLTGLDIYFSSVEMNIAFKEEYLKSEKDIEDAMHLRKYYLNEINEIEIEKIKEMIRRVRLK